MLLNFFLMITLKGWKIKENQSITVFRSEKERFHVSCVTSCVGFLYKGEKAFLVTFSLV